MVCIRPSALWTSNTLKLMPLDVWSHDLCFFTASCTPVPAICPPAGQGRGVLQLGGLWVDAEQRKGQHKEIRIFCSSGCFGQGPIHIPLCAGKVKQLRIMILCSSLLTTGYWSCPGSSIGTCMFPEHD